MSVAGIICEYDPFHKGHAWHMAETRRRLGEDCAVVCCMSGHWTQRAGCAVLDKWTRASMALDGGADLVVELPLPWSMSTAERFARGGVALLAAAGVRMLSFGSESGDLPLLARTAAALDSGEFRSALSGALTEGASFASARQRALEALLGPQGACVRQPNDNLGVEYLRAVRALEAPVEALAIPRRGAGHHSSQAEEGFASATQIRQLLLSGARQEAAQWMPPGALDGVEELCDPARMERAILARLRIMEEADFAALPDSGAAEGLHRRLHRASRQAASLTELYALAKTKRYSHARLRRMTLSAYLGLRGAELPETPPYLRVLGMNGRGMELLRHIKVQNTLPVLTKPAHVKGLPEEAQRLFRLEARATDLYALGFPTVRPCGQEWQRGPVVRR